VTSALLDTSAVVAYLRGQVGSERLLHHHDRLVLTPVVLAEVGLGLRARSRPREQAAFDELVGAPRVELAVIDGETAVRWVTIVDALRRAGTPIPANDAWIAASAMQHGLRVLTTDPHVERIPQILVERLEPA
jgi:tRNA(fMet)-specific endonuclease VapC